MKRLILYLFIFFASLNVNGQWVKLNSNTTIDCSSIFFLNSDTGFICGQAVNPSNSRYEGLIIRTLDGGVTWDTTHINFFLMDIFFINDLIGFIGGQDGAVYKTIDMGNSWIPLRKIGFNYDFSNMYFFNSDTGFVQTFDGFIMLYKPNLFITDSLIVASPATTWFIGTGELNFTSGVGYFAGGNGIFAKSYSKGLSWNYYNCDSSIYVFDAKMIDTNKIVIVGGTDDNGFGVGEYGKSTVSIDGGVNWSTANKFAPHDIVAVDFYNDLNGYCVGGINSLLYNGNASPVGSIWYTTDGGYNWTLSDSSYSDQITDILIINDSLAFAAGVNGLILKNNTKFSTIGISENQNENTISFFPNPVKNKLTISKNKELPYQINFTVFDFTGRLIETFQFAKANKTIELNTEKWPSGIYTCRLQIGNMTQFQKIVKVE